MINELNPMHGRPLTAHSRHVLDTVRRFPDGISTVGLTAETGDTEKLSKTLGNLRQQGYIINAGTRGESSRWMCKDSPHARSVMQRAADHQPAAPRKKPGTVTPTELQKKWSSGQLVHRAPATGNSTNLFKRPTYDGAELKPYTGRPDANDHMNCGTVVNGTWKPYTPPGLHLVGATGPVVLASGGGRRFAK